MTLMMASFNIPQLLHRKVARILSAVRRLGGGGRIGLSA
jgi:hypothetical protein